MARGKSDKKMMKSIIFLAMASAFASGSTWAESHRLAFSKSEQIEIFVDHATGASWCSPQLNMRVVYLAEPNPSALTTLMPKLGALLNQQCPAATVVNWTSANAKGVAIAHGTSSKASNWTLATTPANLANTDTTVAAAPPVAKQDAPALPTVTNVAAEPPTAVAPALVAAPAAPTPPVADEVAPLAQTEPKPAQEPIAAAPVVAAATQSAALVQTPAASTNKPTEEAPAPAPVPAPIPTAAAPAAPTVDFTVNGWKPQSDSDVRIQAKFLTTMLDQNGCKIVSRFNLGDATQYLSLKSEGLSCAPNGYAEGKGRLALVRSDGALLTRTNNLWFASGIPFTKEVTNAQLAATNGKDTLWLHLGQDNPSQSYYLLRAYVNIFDSIGVWQVEPRIDAVTANEAVFRQADEIKSTVLSGLTALQNTAMPGAGYSRLVFANDFEKGVVNGERDHLLYAINVDRPTDWRTNRATGEWRLDLRRGTNHLFQRDERLAQQKRLEEQKLAQQKLMEEEKAARLLRAKLMENANRERSKLASYESLLQDSKAGPKKILADLQNDVDYTLVLGGNYNRLVGGKTASITRIVRVKGSDGDDAKVNWPYDMRLVNQKALKNQWYVIKGEVTLDGKRLDSENLPLTLVTANEDGILPCAKDGCLDLAEPLTVVRLRFNDPLWTPKAAIAIIEQADHP